MTLLLLDGCEDGLMNLGKYFTGYTSTVTSPVRTAGGKAANSISNPTWRALPAEEHATFIAGMGVCPQSLSTSRRIFSFNSDTGATGHLSLYVLASGQLQVQLGNGTVLGTTTLAFPLVQNVYRHIEFKATLSDTVGAFTVRLDESVVLSATNIDTKNGGTKTVFDTITFNYDQGCYWDDLYVCNGANADDFRGDCIVVTSLPNNNGNSSILAGSDGNSVNNYALVNEVTPDTTTYVGSATTGDKDTYAFADLPYTAGAVKGVVLTSYAAKSDAGARTARSVVRSAGTDYPSAVDVALSTSYTTYRTVLETDPATSAAWTIAGFNAAEFGFEARP